MKKILFIGLTLLCLITSCKVDDTSTRQDYVPQESNDFTVISGKYDPFEFDSYNVKKDDDNNFIVEFIITADSKTFFNAYIEHEGTCEGSYDWWCPIDIYYSDGTYKRITMYTIDTYVDKNGNSSIVKNNKCFFTLSTKFENELPKKITLSCGDFRPYRNNFTKQDFITNYPEISSFIETAFSKIDMDKQNDTFFDNDITFDYYKNSPPNSPFVNLYLSRKYESDKYNILTNLRRFYFVTLGIDCRLYFFDEP